MELDRDDANNLAVPIADVAKLYDVKVDPRLEAYGTLVMAVAFVYGPKLKAIMERKRGDNARNVTRDAPASNGAAPADDLDFSRMTAGRFH
jgi:hypothetical protein